MNKEEFVKELNKLNISLSTYQLEQLDKYKDYLIEYNKHTNLTRIIDEQDIFLKHFYDSLTITKYIDLSNYNNLLDIGTGAGFPGIVLKILYPNLNITLLDSNNKKIKFLSELSKILNIDITLVNDRAENYIKTKREYYDVVVSRAVAALPILLELTIPFVKINGYFISMKGNAEEELLITKNTPNKLGAKLESVNNFKLINENSDRTIILYKKITPTDNLYPRIYDKIKKKPLL